jgi:fructose-bisphosphate aldolase class 1
MSELISQYEWAKRSGFSKQYANKLVKNGTIRLIDGKVDIDEANAILASIRNPSRQENRRGFQNVSDLSTLLLKTRIKNEMEKGKILEAKARTETGELVPVEEVKISAFNKARIVRDNLLNIPDRVASQLASISDEKKIHEVLLMEIRTVLEALAENDS